MTDSHALETLTAADFRNVKGSRFKVMNLEFELADVTESGANLPAPFRRQFSVLFHGPIEPILRQATYRLEHEQLGVIELFLVPVGPDSSAESPVMGYEAVFG